jgi:hypothetical protein
LINDTYDLNKHNPVSIEQLGFREKVFLGALLRTALSENMKIIKPLEVAERSLAATLVYTKEY